MSEEKETRTGRFAHWIYRWRWLVIIGTLVSVIGIGYGASKLKMNTSYRVWFNEGSDRVHEYDKFRKRFAQDNVLLIAFERKNGIFNSETMTLIQRLTKAFWKTKYVTRVDSLTNYSHTYVYTKDGEDNMNVKDLIEAKVPDHKELKDLFTEYASSDSPITLGKSPGAAPSTNISKQRDDLIIDLLHDHLPYSKEKLTKYLTFGSDNTSFNSEELTDLIAATLILKLPMNKSELKDFIHQHIISLDQIKTDRFESEILKKISIEKDKKLILSAYHKDIKKDYYVYTDSGQRSKITDILRSVQFKEQLEIDQLMDKFFTTVKEVQSFLLESGLKDVPDEIDMITFEKDILKNIPKEKDKQNILTYYSKDNKKKAYILKKDLTAEKRTTISNILKSIQFNSILAQKVLKSKGNLNKLVTPYLAKQQESTAWGEGVGWVFPHLSRKQSSEQIVGDLRYFLDKLPPSHDQLVKLIRPHVTDYFLKTDDVNKIGPNKVLLAALGKALPPHYTEEKLSEWLNSKELTQESYTDLLTEVFTARLPLYEPEVKTFIKKYIKNDQLYDVLKPKLFYTANELEEKGKIALSEKLVRDLLVSKDGKTTQIIITPKLPDNAQRESLYFLSRINTILKKENDRQKALGTEDKFHIAGLPQMVVAFSDYIQKDMGLMLPMMFIFILLTMLYLFRPGWGFIGITSVIVVFFVMALIFNVTMKVGMDIAAFQALKVLLLLVVLAELVHFSVLFIREYRQSGSIWKAFLQALFKVLDSMWGMISPILVVIFSIVVTMGVTGFIGYELNNITSLVPQILMAIGIADSIHILSIFFRELRHGKSKKESMITSIKLNLLPCFLTSVTTSLGFLSLLASISPPIRVLGVIIAIGSLLAFIITVTFLPALLSVLPFSKKVGHKKEESMAWTRSLGHFVIQKRTPILVTVSLITVVFTFFITMINVDNNPVNYFKKGTYFRDAMDFVDEKIKGANIIEVSINSMKEDGIKDPKFLKKVEKFQKYLEKEPTYHVSHTNSLGDIIKTVNQRLNKDEKVYYKIPDVRKELAEDLFLYTQSVPFGRDINNQVNVNQSTIRLTVRRPSTSSEEGLRVMAGMDDYIAKNMSEYETHVTGQMAIFNYIAPKMSSGVIIGLGIAIVVITIILMITFKSIKMGLLSLVPNVIPLLLMFGLVGITGTDFNIGLSMVAIIALGIVVDDTIHFMTKYLRARKMGKSIVESVYQVFHDVGSAILYTSVVLSLGFGIFVFSSFGMNKDLGVFTAFTMMVALVLDLLFLPALLLLRAKKSAIDSEKEIGERLYAND